MTHYFTNNENLESKLRTIKYKYNDYEFNFTSDLGVFSKDNVDFASKLLIETFFKYAKKDKSVLDIGCGYGLIGITIAKILNCQVTMTDINKRALHLAKINASNNLISANILESNIYEKIETTFDYIITNPPIRAGKKVYMKILEDAILHLKNNGELWFVMNKDHGAKSTIKCLEKDYNLQILEKSKGFFVIVCKKR